MDVRFLGIYKKTKGSTGCASCGSRSKGYAGQTRITRKTMYLTSGRALDVVVGQPVTVSDVDGFMLLDLEYDYNGKRYKMFEVV